jgi:Leucine-rich repeat (LRR) protein
MDNLQTLFVVKNQLRALPSSLGYMDSLQTIGLSDNPLLNIPQEIQMQDAEVIKEYLRQQGRYYVIRIAFGGGMGIAALAAIFGGLIFWRSRHSDRKKKKRS